MIKFQATKQKQRNFNVPVYELNGTLIKTPFPDKVIKKAGNQKEVYPASFMWENKFEHVFDPRNKRDKDIINFLKNSPLCENSPLNDGKPMYRMIDTEAQAETMISLSIKKTNAAIELAKVVKFTEKGVSIINEDKFRMLSLVCGEIDYSEENEKEALAAILKAVEGNPQKVLNVLTGKSAKYEVLFAEAKKLGVLKGKGGFYAFNGMQLGNQKTTIAKISAGTKEGKFLFDAISVAVQEAKS